jgi:hypothetical protein
MSPLLGTDLARPNRASVSATELAGIFAAAYFRLLRQRDHKSRIQATLDQKTPVLLSCYRVPPE